MVIQFIDRELITPVYAVGLSFEVERMRWDIQGGPASADVLVRGPANRLGEVVQLLRCGVMISDETGGAAWWGFVNGVEISLSSSQPSPLQGDGEGSQVFSVSLDELYNRVAVRYQDERISPDVSLGPQWLSNWAQDNNSVTQWGKKEKIITKAPASPEETRNLRAALLEEHKRPRITAVPSTPERGGWARLRLVGWWNTLSWLYFSESRGYVGFEGGGANQNIGNVAASTFIAQSFSVNPGWIASTAWFKIGKYGGPGDNLTVYLDSDVASAPGAVLATSAVVAGASLSGDTDWVRFDFGTPYALVAGTTYWIDVRRSGAVDANNYYRHSIDEGLPFAGGALLIWNGAAWVARVPNADMVFQLTGQAVTTDQIKTMADPAGAGQFLKGVFVVDASGVSGRLYRDGSKRARDEIQALIEQGDASGARLMATITADRWLLVKLVPAIPDGGSNLAELVLLPSGDLRTRSGAKLPGSFNPVGKWARLAGLDQLGGDRNAPGCVLISQAEWSQGRLSVAWD